MSVISRGAGHLCCGTIRKKEAGAKQDMLGEQTYPSCFLPVVGKGSSLSI